MTLHTVAVDIAAWQTETFGPPRERTGPVEHMAKEVCELHATLDVLRVCTPGSPQHAYYHADALKELADVFHLMVQVASDLGATPDTFAAAVERKLAVNRQRKWKAPDARGIVEHVK